jgi:2-dehydro-3-deoxygalactonokinase
MKGALICLDWGTTALRGWLLSADGTVLERRAGGPGIMAVEGGFEAACRAFTAEWHMQSQGPPIIAAGMVGSRQGWVEAPYVRCPAGFADVAGRCIQVEGEDLSVRIVPGLSWQAPDGMPDVMRGEETQVFGALESGAQQGLFILPGTHSKWVRVEAGRVVSFATWMTGELFAVLRGHSILGRMMSVEAPHDAEAFAAGAADGLHHGDQLPRRLFGVRTRGLLGGLDDASAPCFLSGLLIGAEIRAARLMPGIGDGAAPVALIGDTVLCQRYAEVLGMAGVPARIADADVTPRGLWRLARAAGMIAP